jgi:hypothetical protein
LKTLFIILLSLLAIGCSESPIAEQIRLQQQQKNKPKLDSVTTVKQNTPSSKQQSSTTVTVPSKETPAISSPSYPKGVKITIEAVVKREFPNLTDATVEFIANNIAKTCTSLVDAEIERMVMAEVQRLEELGIHVSVDRKSPVNASHKFDYTKTADNTNDSLKWRQSTSKKKKN